MTVNNHHLTHNCYHQRHCSCSCHKPQYQALEEVNRRAEALVATVAPADEPPMWTLDEALGLCQRVWAACEPEGWHVALTGGVLIRGSSKHDLDLVAYPRQVARDAYRCLDVTALRRALQGLGWKLRSTASATRENWRERGIKDRKHVEIWRTGDGRRVDVMVLR